MRKTLFALIVVISFALVACAGGGSGTGKTADADDDTANDDDDDDVSDDDSDNDDADDDDTFPPLDDDATDDDTFEDIWTDKPAHLTWQNNTAEADSIEDATAYCDALDLAGYDDWRVPTISELRSLIRGCMYTETGSDWCSAADDCTDFSCECGSYCDLFDGPGPNGEYWPSDVTSGDAGGDAITYTWTQTPVTGEKSTDYGYWNIGFLEAHVSAGGGADIVRCVRPWTD